MKLLIMPIYREMLFLQAHLLMGIDKITDQQGYLVISNEGAVLAVSYFSADKYCQALSRYSYQGCIYHTHLSDFWGDSC